jgi:ubiquinone/menaquinone biosynthesis C-methylase UbiE
MLEREERDSFQKPDEVMKALAFRPGEVVAEIGPGSGYFTTRVARAVGPEGKVHALDASQEMLDYLIRRLRVERLTNVIPTKISSHSPGLPEGGVDSILMVDVLHYIPEKAVYAQKLKARLRPDGRIIVIDYTVKPLEERPWGPPPEQQASREEMDAAMATAGLRVREAFDFLPEQYIVVYESAL